MEFVKVAQTDNFEIGEKRKITVHNTEILLISVQNTYYAIANKCPHRASSLCDCEIDKYNIICPKHGSIFDIRTGDAVQGAKILFVNVKVDDVKRYPVIIEGSDILVGVE
jgi:3-phenylpropionate/trans-cinnamate dioxygenase ferredoxin subunit